MAALSTLHVIFLIHGVSSICSSNNPKRFVTDPISVTVKEGDNATFTCVVSNFNEDTDLITWYVNPTLYDRKITSSFNETSQAMASTLTIIHVGRREQAHHCVLYALDDHFNVHMCHSETGTLHVRYFSDEDDLQCGPKDQLLFDENEFIRAWCNVSYLDPAILVKWYLGDATLASDFQPLQDSTQDLHKSFQIRHEFHNKNLTCALSSPTLFPGQEILCSIGPIVINEKPKSPKTPGVANTSVETFEISERNWTHGGQVGNVTSKDYESALGNIEALSKESNTNSFTKNNPDTSPLGKGFLDGVTNVMARYNTTSPIVFDAGISLPNQLTKNNFLTIIIGAVIAAFLLITCLFTVVIIVLYMHFNQPRRSLTINDLQELQKFTSIIPNQPLQSCQYSGQSDLEYDEPEYDEPQALQAPLSPKPICQRVNCLRDSYDSHIFDSKRPDSSSSSITVSSTSSHDLSDNDITSRETDIDTSNYVYGNQLVVDMDVPTLKKLKSRFNGRQIDVSSTFPPPPPLPKSNRIKMLN